jgi:hypothetical protein
LHQDLGPEYKKEHLKSYAKHLRPWDKDIPYERVKADVKGLYDKKTDYEKLQKGLLATTPGSKEESKFLKKNKSIGKSDLKNIFEI